ncbi:MAG TPA: hypothetical protein PLH43_06980 [Acetivibrio sp.]|uniref:hypothetical protein n=1 Tax=Acetivibrio sp. TaxID=1872092 RepID=UPI002C1DBCA1|nr:hypothetical protein [Acetivibrio sp.]HOM02554.1 hypothetical protein [Acetivibrio sp.]
MLQSKDIELLEIMTDSLDKYLKAAGRLSDDAFGELSKHYGLLWMELTRQKEIIEELIRSQNLVEDPVQEQNTVMVLENVEQKNVEQENIEQKNVGQETVTEEKHSATENAAVKLYDSMVDFLKQQKYIELQWVRVYAVKCPQEGFYDFQIKYFEHKNPQDTQKNYILFGDATTNYSIKKKDDEIIGDTSQCFEFILNLRDKLGIKQL